MNTYFEHIRQKYQKMPLKKLKMELRDYNNQQAKSISDLFVINYLENLIDKQNEKRAI